MDYLKQCAVEDATARPCKGCGAMLTQGQRMSLRAYKKATRDSRRAWAASHDPQCSIMLSFGQSA
jgi:hypothetical protein